ncbi:MAG: type I DNA topoisomerase [Chloroflexota bacterium]
MKCKQKREMQNPEATFTSSGTPATTGVCPVCGTRLFRMGRTEAHAGLTPPEVRAPKRNASAARRKGKLVIVESPAKARTVGRFLGTGYNVRASMGHVRDLLRSRLSVDVDNGFTPEYRVPNEKRDVVAGLKGDVARAVEVFLATDPDREGEAIAWHLLEAAEIDPEKAKRVVFHEITEPAIREAFAHPRSIDTKLVDAQQARRILDRLVGYSLSPLLWAKVRGRLSAGRVQSAAVRLVVDREREIRSFVPREYWTIDAELIRPDKPPSFRARLVRVDGEAPSLGSQAEAQALVEDLRTASYRVDGVRRGTRQRRPLPPFTTSTLQQDASRRLAFTARRTMAVAQQLYEGIEVGEGGPTGLITYMRTDSTSVSPLAQAEARQVIERTFGPQYLPEQPPVYRTRTRGAQEAHEAIRPTSALRNPESVQPYLNAEQLKLYTLVWQRFLASQMNPAEYDTGTVEVEGRSSGRRYRFRLTASSLRFPGFLAVYQDVAEENGEAGEDEGELRLPGLPDVEDGEVLTLVDLFPEQHFTQPPPRYTEATLVRALEEYGIGRPSTYAPILTTIQQRGYVRRENKRLVPTETGEVVNDLLVEHFPEIVDLGFTARMEDELDEIADGERIWVDVVKEFYGPFAEQVKQAETDMPEVRAEPEVLNRACRDCGRPLVIRHGRFGKFIGCTGFPECRYTEPWLERLGIRCPQDGGEIVERRTRRGRVFYGCSNYPDCDFTSWKRPLPQPCPNCGGMLVADNREHAICLACDERWRQAELPQPAVDVA